MTDLQIEKLTSIIVKRGLHYSELRTPLNRIKKHTGMKFNTTETIGRIRDTLNSRYKNGGWLEV